MIKAAMQTLETRVLPRFHELIDTHRLWLRLGVLALLGGILANSVVFKTVAPFGAAFCGALSRQDFWAGAAGAILGSALSGNPDSAVRYILPVLLMAAFRYWRYAKGSRELSIVGKTLLSLGTVFSVSLTMAFISGIDPYRVILVIGESMMAAGSTYFFVRSLAAAEALREGRPIPRQALPCLTVTFGIFIIAMTEWEIFTLSVGRILAGVFILLCTVTGQEKGGAVAGVTAGAAVSLVSSRFRFLMGTYSFGGLMAGMFSSLGKLGSALVFLFVTAISSVLFGENILSLVPVLEAICAVCLFLIFPTQLLHRLAQESAVPAGDTLPLREALLSRLSCASDALREIAFTTRKVSDCLGSMEEEPIGTVFEEASQKLCRQCGSYGYCWKTREADTRTALKALTVQLRKNGALSREGMPDSLKNQCCKPEKLALAINQCYGEYLARSGTRQEIVQVRQVVTDQFEGAAMALSRLGQELQDIRSASAGMQKRLRRLFEGHRLPLLSLQCYEDAYDRMTIRARLRPGGPVRWDEDFLTDLDEVCGRDFDIPQLIDQNGSRELSFHEKARFSPSFGAGQCAFGKEPLCGDSFEMFRDIHGRLHLILSDGMGTGGRAAVDSSMASRLMARLIEAGFDYDAALKLVNSALLVKSREESLATLDAVCLDLFTGQADFYKAGAAPAFVRQKTARGFACRKLEAASLPAGILRGVQFSHQAMTLKEGDVVVLVSDGATMTGDDWILPELELYGSMPPGELAEKISRDAKLCHMEGCDDDVTVLVLKLQGPDD